MVLYICQRYSLSASHLCLLNLMTGKPGSSLGSLFYIYLSLVAVIQLLSRIHLFATPRTAACQASLSSAISQSLLTFMSIEVVMLSIHLILCHSLLLLPSIFPIIRVFSSESSLHIRWPKYWSFSNRPSNEYSGLISFRIDWLDLLAIQGTLQCFLQHHN